MSKQTKLKDPQEISFIGQLDEANGATMFFIIEKSEEPTLNFSQNSVTIIWIMETQKTLTKKVKNLQQKNGILLTVNQKVITHTMMK